MQMNTCNIYVSYKHNTNRNIHESFIQLKMQNINNTTKISVSFFLIFSKGNLATLNFFFKFSFPFKSSFIILNKCFIILILLELYKEVSYFISLVICFFLNIETIHPHCMQLWFIHFHNYMIFHFVNIPYNICSCLIQWTF